MAKPTFHNGEIAVQQQAGETGLARRNERALSDTIRPGALPFIENQSFAVVASVDAHHEVWATIVAGEPGFAIARTDRVIDFPYTKLEIPSADNLFQNLASDPRIGLLFIEPATRRRLRVNGTTDDVKMKHLRVHVHEAYPNCPKYIQKRTSIGNDDVGHMTPKPVLSGTIPNKAVLETIRKSDTFFVASSNPAGELDVSHRGGPPGFIEVVENNILRIPDYAGNGMFNTLGNIHLNPRVGLVFYDFSSQVTQLIGRGKIRWDLEDRTGSTGGTGRFWEFRIYGWRVSHLADSKKYILQEYSSFNPPLIR